eukprot:10892602-Heterocapsa_arctica.AAC.1
MSRGLPAGGRSRGTWQTSASSRPLTAMPSWTRTTATAEQGNLSRVSLAAHPAKPQYSLGTAV